MKAGVLLLGLLVLALHPPVVRAQTTPQPPAAVTAQTGLTATQVSGVDQLRSQVAAQLQQLATDRAAELAKSPAQSDRVHRKYDFVRVRFAKAR